MMKATNNTEVKTTAKQQYVIGPGGVRMTYQEWLDMRKAELN